MLNRLYKWSLYLSAFVLPVIFLSSCSTTKKATVAVNKTASKPLTAEQRDKIKGDYYDASKQRILGNYNEALFLFKECLAIDPNNSAANFEIGDILEADKKPDSAITYATKAVRQEPNNVWYEELYAECLQDKGMYKDVINVYDGLVKAHPSVTDYYFKLAVAQIQAQEYEEAAATYQAIEKLDPIFNDELVHEEIKIYERAKDYPKAEMQVQRLINHDSTQTLYYNMLGDLYEMEGKGDKAFEVYKKLEQVSPNDPLVHLSLADYYRTDKQKDYRKSFEELKLAFKQPSLEIETKMRIVLSFYQLSNGHDTLNSQGLELCDIMVKANPNEPKAHAIYGDLLVRNHEYIEARDQYVAALQEDSSKYVMWSQLLQVYAQLRDYNNLGRTSKDAISLFPNYPVPYLFNGIANIQEKNYDVAVNSLTHGIDYVINDTALTLQFYANLGDVYYYAKRYKSSDSAYEADLKLNPNDDYVLNNYSYYLSVRDTMLDKAELMSKKSNFLSPNNASYLDTYAWILYRQGKYQDAKYWEEKSLSAGGNTDPSVFDHYGDILYKSGDKDKAFDNWQKAKDMGLKSDLLDKKIRDKQLYDK